MRPRQDIQYSRSLSSLTVGPRYLPQIDHVHFFLPFFFFFLLGLIFGLRLYIWLRERKKAFSYIFKNPSLDELFKWL